MKGLSDIDAAVAATHVKGSGLATVWCKASLRMQPMIKGCNYAVRLGPIASNCAFCSSVSVA